MFCFYVGFDFKSYYVLVYMGMVFGVAKFFVIINFWGNTITFFLKKIQLQNYYATKKWNHNDKRKNKLSATIKCSAFLHDELSNIFWKFLWLLWFDSYLCMWFGISPTCVCQIFFTSLLSKLMGKKGLVNHWIWRILAIYNLFY